MTNVSQSAVKRLNAIAALCVGAVVAALISQHFFDMPPCAWCVLQRLILLVIAGICWLGALLGGRSSIVTRLAGLLAAVASALGLWAGWYQYTVAANMFSCDQTFADRFMVASGLDADVPWLFGIFASCMDAQVELFGVEYVFWAMALFAIVGILSVTVAIGRRA